MAGETSGFCAILPTGSGGRVYGSDYGDGGSSECSDWSRSGGEGSGRGNGGIGGRGGGRLLSGRQSNFPAWMTPGTAAAAQVAATGEGSSSQSEHQKDNASDERHLSQPRAPSDPARLSELASHL